MNENNQNKNQNETNTKVEIPRVTARITWMNIASGFADLPFSTERTDSSYRCRFVRWRARARRRMLTLRIQSLVKCGRPFRIRYWMPIHSRWRWRSSTRTNVMPRATKRFRKPRCRILQSPEMKRWKDFPSPLKKVCRMRTQSRYWDR